MAKSTFLDFSTTAGDNTDCGGIGILGTNSVSNFDNAFRTLMAILRRDLDNGTVFATKSGAYTAVANDNNAFYEFTATATLTLTAAATLGADWHMMVFANGGDVTIDADGTELINGAETLVVADGNAAYLICTGSAFKAIIFGDPLSGPQIKGHIYGLTLSNNATDATNDIDIAAGEAASTESDPFLMALASALTKRLDATWAVGSGNGGLDTGSIANATYHVWLIQRSDTGVVDALFSTSATAPTMPANYDRKRRIGSILREAGAIVAFTQDGDVFLRTNPMQSVNTTSLGTTATLFPLAVPTGIKVNALLTGVTLNASPAIPVYISSPYQADLAPSAVNFTAMSPVANVGGPIGSLSVRTDTSGRVRARSQASATTLIMSVNGWVDTRGRN